MVHSLIVLALAAAMLVLVWRRLIQIDLFFPWFVAITVLGVASTSSQFVNLVGVLLGIAYPPIAVIFLVFFLQLGIIVSLTISVSRLRERVAAMAKQEALRDLAEQEQALRRAGER